MRRRNGNVLTMRTIQLFVPKGCNEMAFLKQQVKNLQSAMEGREISDEQEEASYWEIRFGYHRVILRQHKGVICVTQWPFDSAVGLQADQLENWMMQHVHVVGLDMYYNLCRMKYLPEVERIAHRSPYKKPKGLGVLHDVIDNVGVMERTSYEFWLVASKLRRTGYPEKILNLLELAKVRVIQGVQPMSKLDKNVKRMLDEAVDTQALTQQKP